MSKAKPSNTPNYFVTTIPVALCEKLKKDLVNQGFEISKPAYTLFSAKKVGVSCTLYESGKLMVQGKEMSSFIEFYLEPEILKSFNFTYQEQDPDLDLTSRIGIDESGKGDFFGPLCVAGVHASDKEILELKKIGVKDSKTMTDKAIFKLGREIKQSCYHHIVKINPAKYNELYEQFKNLNHLLAWGHATAIENLVERTNCQNVIIDQFADESVVIRALKRKNMQIELTQRHKGEEDVVVAAASILARMTFVESLEKMSEQYGIEIPKGASNKTVAVGKKLVKDYGPEVLKQIGKYHFKTSALILNGG